MGRWSLGRGEWDTGLQAHVQGAWGCLTFVWVAVKGSIHVRWCVEEADTTPGAYGFNRHAAMQVLQRTFHGTQVAAYLGLNISLNMVNKWTLSTYGEPMTGSFPGMPPGVQRQQAT